MRIECPPTEAFDLMADPRNELRWNSGVSEAELMTGEPIGEGSRFWIADKRGRHEVEITAYQRPERLSFFVEDRNMDVQIDFAFGSEGAITTMTGTFHATGKRVMGIILPLLIPLIRRQLAKEHGNFVALCEAKAQAAPYPS
jgi:uncharacterized protein YndB with AHSA1/START domain